MKTLFFAIWTFVITSSAIAQEDESGCNRDIPGWGESLGKVRFVSNRVWTIGVHTWSDAVTAENCKKKSFNGGERGKKQLGYNADCRQNIMDSYGDLFSWCAVKRYRNQLCPTGWRAPTTEDFMALSQWLEGTPHGWNYNERFKTIDLSYNQFDYPEWGGTNGGWCDNWGRLYSQGQSANYWAQSANSLDTGMEITFYLRAMRFVATTKNYGHVLRCVRTD